MESVFKLPSYISPKLRLPQVGSRLQSLLFGCAAEQRLAGRETGCSELLRVSLIKRQPVAAELGSDHL